MADTGEQLDADPSTSWWVWGAWIEKGTDSKFLYSCAARAYRAPGWQGKDLPIALPGGGSLQIRQRTAPARDFDPIRAALDQGSVKLEPLLGAPVPETAVLASRRIIQSALGHHATRADCYYTLPDLEPLLDGNEDAWRMVLSTLQSELGLPFQTDYAGRIGNFEIFDLESWLDRAQPFQIEAIPDRTNPADFGPRTLRISRDPEFAKDRHIAHVVGRAGGDVLLDRLVTLEAGQERSEPLVCAEPLVDYDFRLFDATGDRLLHFEHQVFMRGVDFTLAPVSRQYVIDDKLTTRAAGKSAELAKAARNVAGYASTRSSVQFGKDGPWRPYSDKMRERAESLFSKPSEDKWFWPGIHSEVAVIQHFNQLLQGGRVQRGVLVDPWFGEHALRQFAIRLGSQDVRLTIVTSWTDRDPDTNQKLDPSKSPTEKLERALNDLRQLVNPHLIVLNLRDGAEQAFHDRYLVLYPFDAPAKVYLLSNSINKMAGDWPFCMSLLAPDAARKAQTYIEGLCRGEDITRATSPEITLKWPSNGT